jgi:hypothetical protein
VGLSGVALAALAVVQLSIAQDPGADAQTAAARRQLSRTPATLRIGPQRVDLVRYNRVEALSLGIRGQLRPETSVGPLSVTATARFGIGDLHLSGRLDLEQESVSRRVAVSGYHELTSLDEQARDFGPGNTVSALLLGQDLGDYYRRSGATVELTPPSARPRRYRLRGYAEYHEGVAKETDVQLERLWNDAARFRPNIAADEGWEVGTSLEVDARSSTDPTRSQAAVHGLVQAATGDFEYVRARLGADFALALPSRFRLLVEGAWGNAWGSPSRQRLWYVGGPMTLNGYAPLTAGGAGFGRTRVALDRRFAFGRLIVFHSAAWAGEWTDLTYDDVRSSAGVGIAILDGIIRFDIARQITSPRDFRFDFYLDQLP